MKINLYTKDFKNKLKLFIKGKYYIGEEMSIYKIDNIVYLELTTLDMQLIQEIDSKDVIEFDSCEKICFHKDVLKDLYISLKNIKEDVITITEDKVICKDIDINISTTQEKQKIKSDETEIVYQDNINSLELLGCIKQSKYAISKDKSREYINSVMLIDKFLITTSGHELLRLNISLNKDIPLTTIPKDSLDLITLFLSSNTDICLKRNKDAITFESGKEVIRIRLIENNLNIKKPIEEVEEKLVCYNNLHLFNIERLRDMLSVVVGEKLYDIERLQINISKDSLVIKGENTTLKVKDFTYEGEDLEDLEIYINKKYLLNLLTLEEESITLKINKSYNPIYYSNDRVVALTMPCRK